MLVCSSLGIMLFLFLLCMGGEGNVTITIVKSHETMRWYWQCYGGVVRGIRKPLAPGQQLPISMDL